MCSATNILAYINSSFVLSAVVLSVFTFKFVLYPILLMMNKFFSKVGSFSWLGAALLFIIFFSSGCEKVIKLKLPDAEKKYVIDASLSDKKDSLIVWISKTMNNEQPVRDVEFVKNATVTVSTSENATPLTLRKVGDENYVRYAEKIQTVPGREYFLQVKIDNEIFTSSCVMPQKVTFDSLYIDSVFIFGKKWYRPVVEFTDPPGLGNCYRFVLWVDGFESATIFVFNDKLFDGRKVKLDLLDLTTSEGDITYIDKYDFVNVDMHCISKPVYDYLYSLNQDASGSPSASPGNPVSNITGNALGFFNVHTYATKRVMAE
ncbi:MAG: DUF4249 domain-containing protein [Niabella sp.]